jgi:hypothetical protein
MEDESRFGGRHQHTFRRSPKVRVEEIWRVSFQHGGRTDTPIPTENT